MIFVLSVVVSLLVSILFLLLCMGKKKKKASVETVKYVQRSSGLSDAVDSEAGLLSHDANSQQQKVVRNGSEGRRPHSSSQASQIRELPQLPLGGAQDNISSQRNSADRTPRTSSEASGGSPDVKHSSPKGRRLPTPPPEGGNAAADQKICDIQDDDDMYAKVDDRQKKQAPVRLKVKTLEIKEGSGDSSFYAKVGDNVEAEDTDLYAQVDEKILQVVKECDEAEQHDSHDAGPSTSKHTSPPVQYPTAEYASIDKLKKTSVKRKPVSNEPPAPPIPDRNFDVDDDAPSSSNQDETDESEETLQGPMYDKLCVRESLDHIRLREEAENERRQRYANISCVNGDSANNAGDLYAQIDDSSNLEAVYESLSQPGSADGTYQPNSATNGGYSSIRELRNATHNEVTPPQAVNGQPDLQTWHHRQHHYEQIERPNVNAS